MHAIMLWGAMDEIRISKVKRLAGWLLTEYNNQNNPTPGWGNFILPFGTEQAASLTVTVNGNLTNLAGAFNLYSTTVVGGNFNLSGGTLTAPSTTFNGYWQLDQ